MTIHEKISALLAKARSTEHEAEAAAFVAKAQALMETHQIELHELGQDDPIGATEGVKAQTGFTSYKSGVQVALAKYYGCRPIIVFTSGRRKWFVDLCGPESARMTTALMTDFVWSQVHDSARAVHKEHPEVNQQEAARHVAKALIARINKEVAARKPKPTTGPGSGLELATLDPTESFIKARFPDLFNTGGQTSSVPRHRTGKSQRHFPSRPDPER